MSETIAQEANPEPRVSENLLGRHYDSARAEIIERVRLRNQIFVLYLGFLGVVIGYALGVKGDQAHPEALATIPLIALGTVLIALDHELLIGRLGKFLRVEYSGALAKQRIIAPHWDGSVQIEGYGRKQLKIRFLGYGIILVSSSAYCAVKSFAAVGRFAGICNMLFTLVSLAAWVWTFRARRELTARCEDEQNAER